MRRLLVTIAAVLCTGAGIRAQHTDSLFYGDSKTLLPNPYGWGFIAGTNAYGDIGKYQRFDFYGDADMYVVGVRIYFGFKRIVGSPDTIRIVARKPAANGSPGELLETRAVTTDVLDTTGLGNVFSFAHPPRIQGLVFIADTIFLGIEWGEWNPAESDTFALFCDPNNFGENLNRVWERILYNNEWVMWPWKNSPDPNFEWTLDSDLWIAALLNASIPVSTAHAAVLPDEFVLMQNYPNPFNPSTRIRYFVPFTSKISLTIHDVLGREIAVLVNEEQQRGWKEVQWDAEGVSSGMYFCRMGTQGFAGIRKMAVVK
jgi:hypothetical protein